MIKNIILVERAAGEPAPLISIGKMTLQKFCEEVARRVGRNAAPDKMVEIRVTSASYAQLYRPNHPQSAHPRRVHQFFNGGFHD